MDWNYGDLLDAVAEAVPAQSPAFIHEERRISWKDADRRMNNLARGLLARGAKAGDKLAFYLRNCPEYMEGVGAALRARLTHVNVNFRYKPEEVRYILENSDTQALIYASEFRDAVLQIRDELPSLKIFIEVTSGREVAVFSERYENIAEEGDGMRLDIRRSPDDLIFIYTGGTTGMPKGVMWRHGDLCELWHSRVLRTTGVALPPTVPGFAEEVKKLGGGTRVLPACPLMHGTGLILALGGLIGGGCVVTVGGAHFDPRTIWAAVARDAVQSLAIVGDPFAKPLLHVLDEEPDRYDLSSLTMMTSSGAMWSVEVKRGLVRHIPQITLTDSFASTEAMGMGMSVMTKDGEAQTAAFSLLENAIVIDENDREIPPGGGAGRVALAGPLPLGYYKDPAKTASVFRTIGNRRYSVPGDYARIEADGTIALLGRGSNCINTAGEKVFPEEVEEALKTHPDVEDALVLGVPDDTWGQAVTALVNLSNGAEFDPLALRDHVRARLAGYKTPKRILLAGIPLRAPNGKADYKSAREFALTAIETGSRS